MPLTIPLDVVRPELGARDDLVINLNLAGPPLPDVSQAVLFLDGVETECDRSPGMIVCRNVGLVVDRIDFVAPPFDRPIYLFMHDLECEEENPACPV